MNRFRSLNAFFPPPPPRFSSITITVKYLLRDSIHRLKRIPVLLRIMIRRLIAAVPHEIRLNEFMMPRVEHAPPPLKSLRGTWPPRLSRGSSRQAGNNT